MTWLLTIIGGIIIGFFMYIITGFYLSPIKKFRSVVEFVDNKLKFHKNIIVSGSLLPGEEKLKTLNEIRQLSCDLESSYKRIPLNKILTYIKVIPKQIKISDSARSLILLSNAAAREEFSNRSDNEIKKVRKNLDIPEI